jgi:mono/diheme cytochrome c family protein
LAEAGRLISYDLSIASEDTAMRPHLLLGGALLAVAVIGVPAAFAQHVTIGAIEYRMSCAVCHGEDARGDGPLTQLLTVKPTDLSKLAKRNNGQFPTDRVVETIDGRMQVSGHGTREMPVWGTRYAAEVGRDYGPYGSETVVKTRILELVHYLQTIQEK